MSIKNTVTPSGIELGTFQFVAQHLNHCATAVPQIMNVLCVKCALLVVSFDLTGLHSNNVLQKF